MIYFQPLRRKLGAILLVLACVLTTVWMRSNSIQDTLTIRAGAPSCIKIVSVSQRLTIAWLAVTTDVPVPVQVWMQENADRTKWTLPFAGTTVTHPMTNQFFATGDLEFSVGNTEIILNWIQFPFWSIVLPLTLLSAYLLLRPARPTTPVTTDVK